MTAAFAFDRPELLRAFPFQHRVEIEIHLDDGGMSVATTVTATGEEAVPIAFGFHPYLRMPGLPRTEWTVSFPVRRRLLLDSKGIPTGATEPVEPIHGAIGDRTWDDGFDRIDTPARFELHAGRRTIALEYTDGYPVAQIFAPPGQDYICVEPMTAPTNALNSPDGGFYSLPAGERFQRNFSNRLVGRELVPAAQVISFRASITRSHVTSGVDATSTIASARRSYLSARASRSCSRIGAASRGSGRWY